MSSTTAHYNLVKASSTEQYDVGVVNSNLNMIDEQMYQNATTPFTGATSNTDGAVGNVPTPLISDKDKVLKGDGTWEDILSMIDFTQLSAQQIADLKTALGIS